MLSPSDFHLRVPRDQTGNLKKRMRFLDQCRGDPQLQNAVRNICARDILFYINLFVWQINPKHTDCEVGPFITWPFQEAAIAETLRVLFGEQDDMLWEKSRECGATWMALIMFDWACLFHKWKKFLCISHSADAVDRAEDKDSLFWKLQFMHDHLPDWITRGVERRKMGFHYPATNSSINGAASTARAGVGGRATAVMLDEFSKQADDYEILGQTADTGPRLFIGTHYGLDGAFYELTQRPDLHKVVMHWSQHPEKNNGLYLTKPNDNKVEVIDKTYSFPTDHRFVTDGRPMGGPFPGLRSPWYDKECLRRASARDVAMHLDIDPKGSVSQFFDPIVIRTLQNTYCIDPEWEGDVLYEQDGKPLGLVARKGGPLKLWLTPDQDGKPPIDQYGIGADVATGSGASNSCLGGARRNGEKILEYANPFISSDEFAVLAVALCQWFVGEDSSPAQLIWEIPGAGALFGKRVIELGFRNVWCPPVSEHRLYETRSSDRPGWQNTESSKRILLEEYRLALGKRECLNRSWLALEECLKFKYTPRSVEHSEVSGGKDAVDPTGARVNHGDRCMADALMWKVIKQMGLVRSVKQEKPVPDIRSLAGRRLLAENQKRQDLVWVR